MKVAWPLFLVHGVALVIGVIGIVIMIPNPTLWSTSPTGIQAYAFSMQYGGAIHIVFGAAAMLAYGVWAIGARRTALFFGAATLISLTFELLGTGTGLPFGAYAYTGGLGPLIEIGAGAVPFTIPLSWFYMGFAAYLLGGILVNQYKLRPAGLWNVLLGAWFLTVWDLALDPAMAYDQLPVRFWVWNEVGPYYGMPLLNLAGWIVTGVTFMTVAQWLWREPLPAGLVSPRFPLAIYFVNLLFCIAICAGFGLWAPIGIALALGAPLLLALRHQGDAATLTRPSSAVPSSLET